MAQISADEEVGTAILKVFEDFGARPGYILKFRHILSGIEDCKYRVEDINKGLKWLLDEGHIEQQEGSRNAYILTDSGYYLIPD
jgi:hypothetical protein